MSRASHFAKPVESRWLSRASPISSCVARQPGVRSTLESWCSSSPVLVRRAPGAWGLQQLVQPPHSRGSSTLNEGERERESSRELERARIESSRLEEELDRERTERGRELDSLRERVH